jgi:hypothetical protein
MAKFMLLGGHSPHDDISESRARAVVQMEWMAGPTASEAVEANYHVADNRRLMIVNVESREALDHFLAEMPDTPTREWEIVELFDIREVIARFLSATSEAVGG